MKRGRKRKIMEDIPVQKAIVRTSIVWNPFLYASLREKSKFGII